MSECVWPTHDRFGDRLPVPLLVSMVRGNRKNMTTDSRYVRAKTKAGAIATAYRAGLTKGGSVNAKILHPLDLGMVARA